jgi:hypothetical protein
MVSQARLRTVVMSGGRFRSASHYGARRRRGQSRPSAQVRVKQLAGCGPGGGFARGSLGDEGAGQPCLAGSRGDLYGTGQPLPRIPAEAAELK